MARQDGTRVQATVTQVDPLHILVDGAETPCPAAIVEQYTIVVVGDRCYAEDRAPRRPLVTGGIKFEDEA
ncbi:MAG TPA: hypothetical protein VK053_16570 [Jiangellaceae bacterium]|nr:hypothetical protein [Jiangellaceae bacterium]